MDDVSISVPTKPSNFIDFYFDVYLISANYNGLLSFGF